MARKKAGAVRHFALRFGHPPCRSPPITNGKKRRLIPTANDVVGPWTIPASVDLPGLGGAISPAKMEHRLACVGRTNKIWSSATIPAVADVGGCASDREFVGGTCFFRLGRVKGVERVTVEIVLSHAIGMRVLAGA